MLIRLAATALLVTVSSLGFAAVVWDETADGSLSADNFDPTNLGVLMMDSNTIRGEIGPFASDHFTVEIVAGSVLDSLFLDDYDDPDPFDGDNNMFMAMVEGSVFPDDYFTVAIEQNPSVQYLGGAIVGVAEEGTDILDNLGRGFIGQGFEAPLGPGTYTFLVQQTGPTNGYTLDFNVSAVPEPSSMVTVAMVAGVLGLRRRRKRLSL